MSHIPLPIEISGQHNEKKQAVPKSKRRRTQSHSMKAPTSESPAPETQQEAESEQVDKSLIADLKNHKTPQNGKLLEEEDSNAANKIQPINTSQESTNNELLKEDKIQPTINHESSGGCQTGNTSNVLKPLETDKSPTQNLKTPDDVQQGLLTSKPKSKQHNYTTNILLVINICISVAVLFLITQMKLSCVLQESNVSCEIRYTHDYIKVDPILFRNLSIVYATSIRGSLVEETMKYLNKYAANSKIQFQQSSNPSDSPYVVVDIVSTIRTSEVIPCSFDHSGICLVLRSGSECEQFHPLASDRTLFELIVYDQEVIDCARNEEHTRQLISNLN